MKKIIILAAIALASGCDKPAPAKPEQTESKKPSQSTAGQAIDYMTGRTAVKSGRKAMDTLKKVGEQERKDFEQAVGQ